MVIPCKITGVSIAVIRLFFYFCVVIPCKITGFSTLKSVSHIFSGLLLLPLPLLHHRLIQCPQLMTLCYPREVLFISGDALSFYYRGLNPTSMVRDDTLSNNKSLNLRGNYLYTTDHDDTLSLYRGINSQIGISPTDKVTVSSIATFT